MRELSAVDLLRVWEDGARRRSADRALALLRPAFPDKTLDDLASLGVGQRDALLFSLRARTFGEQMEGFAECPACGERMEFALSASEILARAPGLSVERPEPETVVMGDSTLKLRLPDSRDISAIEGAATQEGATSGLLARCVIEARRGGAAVSPGDLSREVIEQIDAWMAARDPLGEVTLELRCPACEHAWEAAFDIVEYFWAEVNARARRLMREVHTLAREYGWSEPYILEMSAARRQGYLELVAS